MCVCVCVCVADSMDSSAKQFVSGDESHMMNGDGPAAGQFSRVYLHLSVSTTVMLL